jgi:hypothetical protein
MKPPPPAKEVRDFVLDGFISNHFNPQYLGPLLEQILLGIAIVEQRVRSTSVGFSLIGD